MSTLYDIAFFSSFVRPNFVVLCLGVTPNECVKDRSKPVDSYATFAACRTWRFVFVLIRQMAPVNLRTLSVCHTRDQRLNGFILKCRLHGTIWPCWMRAFSADSWTSCFKGHRLFPVVIGRVRFVRAHEGNRNWILIAVGGILYVLGWKNCLACLDAAVSSKFYFKWHLPGGQKKRVSA